MVQIHYARKKRQLEYSSNRLQQLLDHPGEENSGLIRRLILRIRKLVSELIHVISRAELKKILGAVAMIVGISFGSDLSGQTFAPPQMNPFGLDSAEYWIMPEFADLDGDGDLDLLAGSYDGYSGVILYYENMGSSIEPQFAAPISNPFGLDQIDPKLIYPSMADLDGDGDLDLLLGAPGENHGVFQYFENNGEASYPHFALPQENPFGWIQLEKKLGFPELIDLDNDGDFDLLVGGVGGDSIAFDYFENTGEASYPQFASQDHNPFGLDSLYYLSVPTFADLDRDGDFDLLVGTYDGYYGVIHYYENSGIPSNPQFELPQLNPFGLDADSAYLYFPEFVDLDADGDMDLLIGGYDYAPFKYYENITEPGVRIPKIEDLVSQVYPNPVKDVLRIDTDEKIERIEILNMQGRGITVMGKHSKEINLGSLVPGIYMLRVTFSEGHHAIRKISKQ